MQHDHSSHGHAAHASASSSHSMTGGMAMFFHNSAHVTLWIQRWTSHTPLQYFLGAVLLVLLAVAHEGLACYRSHALARVSKSDGSTASKHLKPSSLDKLHLAALYSLNLSTGYLLMLAVMTYNVGYFLAVAGGLGLGYALFFDRQAGHSGASRADGCHVRLVDGE